MALQHDEFGDAAVDVADARIVLEGNQIRDAVVLVLDGSGVISAGSSMSRQCRPEIVGQYVGGRYEPAAGVDGDHRPVDLVVFVELAARPFARLLRRAVVNALRRMGDQAGRHRDAVQRAAVEERDLVVVDVAVIPRRAFGARHALGGLGQEVHHVDAGGLHEQVHGRRQVHAVGGHHVVVGDIEREREVVAAPALDVERMMLVVKRCRPAARRGSAGPRTRRGPSSSIGAGSGMVACDGSNGKCRAE